MSEFVMVVIMNARTDVKAYESEMCAIRGGEGECVIISPKVWKSPKNTPEIHQIATKNGWKKLLGNG